MNDADSDVPVQLAIGCDVYEIGTIDAEAPYRPVIVAELLHAVADYLTDDTEDACPVDG